MRATEVLKQEHRVIEQVLDCLERMASSAEALDREAAAEALQFLVDFADRRHHGKEEDLLFKAMADRGMPADVGPIGVMLAEHVTGRATIVSMTAALNSEASDAEQRFSQHALKYVLLLREHIQKEDHILYPMADSVLDEAAEQGLAAAFAKLEAYPGEEHSLARDLEIAERLAARFEVTRAADREATAFEGCCHQHGGEAGGSCH